MSTLYLFFLHLQLYSLHILTKSFTTDSLKPYIPVKSVHFKQNVSIMLAIVAYYASIMLNAFAFPLCSKLC